MIEIGEKTIRINTSIPQLDEYIARAILEGEKNDTIYAIKRFRDGDTLVLDFTGDTE